MFNRFISRKWGALLRLLISIFVLKFCWIMSNMMTRSWDGHHSNQQVRMTHRVHVLTNNLSKQTVLALTFENSPFKLPVNFLSNILDAQCLGQVFFTRILHDFFGVVSFPFYGLLVHLLQCSVDPLHPRRIGYEGATNSLPSNSTRTWYSSAMGMKFDCLVKRA